MEVYDSETVRKAIDKYQLQDQYKKACNYLKSDLAFAVQLKLRKPTKAGIWQFRVTKKYRAYAKRLGDKLYIFEISDHQ